MHLNTSTVELPGKMGGYYAHPVTKEPLPGVIVIQEIWGVDAHIRDVTDRVASAGYAAIAPDLFSSGGGRPDELAEPRVAALKGFLDTLPHSAWMNLMDPVKRETEIEKLPEAQRASMRETIGSLFTPDRFARMATYAQELEAVAGWLRARPEVFGKKLAAMGFCMGGGLAGMLAARDAQLGAAAIFYGQPPSAEAIANISCPVIGLFGQQDERLVAQLPAFEQAMKQAGKTLDLHVYPGAGHAFFNDTRASYQVAASRDAWARTLSLFATALT